MSDLSGNRIPETIGRYSLERELGRGASAAVYLARDGLSGESVAVKLFWHGSENRDLMSGRHRTLFLNEAALVGRLEHPHIVALLDAAVEPDFSYVVMEYVEGSTLSLHTTADVLLPLEKVVEIVYKASRALEYAHRQGVIHRDIKPANILLTPDLDIKLSDFGVALLANVTHTALDLVGSPAYASPEQIAGKRLEVQTDMWSLGVVMYQLLTGRVPFMASSHPALMYNISNIDHPPLSSLREGLPVGIVEFVDRAMQKDPAARHPRWNDFSADLVRLVRLLEVPSDEGVSEARKFEALRDLWFFQNFREVEIWEVLRASTWRQIADGTTLIREGERGESFFVLVDGEVEVSRAGSHLATLVAGGCFGEMLYFEEEQILRSTSVHAKTAAVAIEIPAAALSAASEACQVQFNRAFLRILLGRLDEANRRLSGG